jgi:eukaryotic-like serine/threonine-protein kinase
MSSQPARTDFDERWKALALGDGAAEVSTDATLCARTLSTLRRSNTMAPPGDAPPNTDAWPALPRVSLGGSRAPRGGDCASPTRPPSDLELGALIGEGAMGRVHVARQRSLDRDVAIKTLKPRHDQADTVRALLHEAVITGGLEHPGVVPVHVLGLDDAGSPVLVMKRVDGVDWGRLLADPEHPGWRSRPEDRIIANLEVLMQVCQAVHFAHSRGILHRDIKPDNVMLGEFGEVYLVDWGIALRQADAAGTDLDLVGTPAYMAPEMVAGGPLDARADVYLLGATLHEVLTGEPRHRGTTLHEVLATAFRSESHTYDASVPRALAQLCNRATHADPEQRPANALAFRQALAQFLQHRGSIAIADEAMDRLHQLEALLHEAADAPPSDLQRAYELASEARFGLTLALRDWSENPTAREGLHAALVASAELELRQEHAGAAAALLERLEPPPAAMLRRLEDIRRRQADARAEHEQLRRMEHELDIGVSGRERTRALFAISFVAALLSGWAATRQDAAALTPRAVLTIGLIVLGAGIVVAVAARRFLFRNAVNRRFTSTLIVLFAGLTINRTVGVLFDLQVEQMLAYDLVLLTMLMVAGVFTLLRELWIVAAVFLASLVLVLADPDHAANVFSVAAIVSVPAVLFALSRHKRDQEQTRASRRTPPVDAADASRQA